MALKYLSGIPFLHLEAGHVEDFFPLMGVWSFNRQIIGNMTGMSDSDIGHLFGNASNPTMMAVYTKVGTDTACDMDGLGFLMNKGTFGPYSTDMYYTSQGWELQDANGTPILTGAAVGSTGIYYPNENNFATSQYLVMGVVDNYNHISFGVLRGSYADVFGMYPSSTQPVYQQDNTLTLATGHTVDEIYELFEDGDWSDSPTPPGPGPEPGREGFDLSNRYNPMVGTNAIGVYPITQNQCIELFDDLWVTNFAETVGNFIGICADNDDCLVGLKWFYGIKSNLVLGDHEDWITIGAKPMDGTHSKNAISVYPAVKEMITMSMGSVNVPAHFNNYLDFVATKYQIYLPFIGFVDLNPNDVVGGTVEVAYNINLVTGTALCHVAVSNARCDSVEMAIPCKVGIDMLTTHGRISDWASASAMMIGRSINIGVKMGTFVPSLTTTDTKTTSSIGVGDDWGESQTDTHRVTEGGSSGLDVQGAVNGFTIPQEYARGNGFSDVDGAMGPLRPYILITRPVKVTPNDLHDYMGYRTCETAKLNTKHGYVKASAIKQESINTNCKYIDEIIALVQTGVIMP